jgi:lipopolysaccharide export system protein LptC
LNRLGISIALIFAAVLALYIPIWLEDDSPDPQSNMEDALVPNYEVSNLSSKLFNEEGFLTHQVDAQKMEHYDQLGFVIFQQPTYTIYLENASQPWKVTAAQGTLYDDNRIQLEENVLITSLSQQEFVKQIETQYMEINLNDRTLVSDQAVQISGVDYVINSIGFKANLETQIYELSNHVQTEYRPTR